MYYDPFAEHNANIEQARINRQREWDEASTLGRLWIVILVCCTCGPVILSIFM